MPPKSKTRRAKADNLEIARRKKVMSEENGEENSEVLNMYEEALEALDMDNESVDPTFDAEASERMDEDERRFRW